jgi:alkaline phosphatase D
MRLKPAIPKISRREATMAVGAAVSVSALGLASCSNAPSQAGSARAAAEASRSEVVRIAPQVKDALAPISRVAFGSCSDQSKEQPVWQAVLADRPDLMLFGGDNIYYSPTLDWNVAGLRQAYAQFLAKPHVAQLLSSVPHMEIWDDHDYGLNDGGLEWPNKQAAKDEFLRFFAAPVFDPRRSREGLYREQIFGSGDQKLQVIMLDTRWFRSALKPTDQRGAPGKERYMPDADASKTMLGEAQWRWLDSRLREPAAIRLIVSSVQILALGHGWECWANMPHERERLRKLIADTRAQGVILLSGDRHIGGFYRETAQAGLAGSYPLLEMTSSGLSHAWAQAREAGPNRIGDLVTTNHYAMINVDWQAHRLTLQFKDVQGQLLRDMRVDFKELRA